MNALVNFIKNLFGKEDFDKTLIGLASFSRGENNLNDEIPKKKRRTKQELTLSQMLKRT